MQALWAFLLSASQMQSAQANGHCGAQASVKLIVARSRQKCGINRIAAVLAPQ